MAVREVTEDDVPKSSGGFARLAEMFPKLGASFTGLYEESAPGNYGTDWTFQNKDGSLTKFSVEDNKLLGKLLIDARDNPKNGLQMTPGVKTTILWASEREVKNQPNKQRIFKLKLDDSTVKGFVSKLSDEPEPAAEEDAPW